MSLHSLARAKDTSTAPKTSKASNAPETPQKSYTHPRATRRARNTSTVPNTLEKPNPHYSACQDTDLSKLEALTGTAEPVDESAKTEAEFCFSCEFQEWKDMARDLVGLKTIEKPTALPHAKEFKERLRKRAIGQVMAKIYQSESTRACLISDEDWFAKKGAQMDKELCTARTKELKQAVKDSYPEMRINMALRDAKLGGSASYGVQPFKMMDDTPSHTALPDTVDIPPLTEEEKQIARDRHIEALSTLKLDKLSPEELAKQLRSKKKLGSTKHHVTGINRKDLTNKDIDKIQDEQKRLREKSEADYLTMIAKMPFLAYLKDGEGKTRDIDQAFFTLSKYLTDFLKKLEDPEVDMAVLLSFNSLAEDLLQEDSKYCLAAEGATIDAKEDESFDDYALMGLGLASIVPCFIAGPVSLSACVTGGTAVGVAGYAEAKAAQRSALDSVLSGANLEKLSEWRANGQNAKIEAMLLPLAVIGAPVATGLRVAKEGIKAVVSATGRGARGATAGREAVKSVAGPRASREAVKSATRPVDEVSSKIKTPKSLGWREMRHDHRYFAAWEDTIYPKDYFPAHRPLKPRLPENPLPMTGDEATDRFRNLYNNGAYDSGAYEGLFLGHTGESRYISVKYLGGERVPAVIGRNLQTLEFGEEIGKSKWRQGNLFARVKVMNEVTGKREWKSVRLGEEELKTARLNPALHEEFRSPKFRKLPMTGNSDVDKFRQAVNKNDLSYFNRNRPGDDPYIEPGYIKLDHFGFSYYGKIEKISRNPKTGEPEVTVNLLDDGTIFDIPNGNMDANLWLGPRVIDNRNLPYMESFGFYGRQHLRQRIKDLKKRRIENEQHYSNLNDEAHQEFMDDLDYRIEKSAENWRDNHARIMRNSNKHDR